jgi:hypothetical protein
LPGRPPGEYDRGERKEFAREFRSWLFGCGIIVLIVILAFVVYAILLIASGWRG